MLLCAGLLLCGRAEARHGPPAPPPGTPVRYLGPHPIAAQLGGGYCYIEVPHLHPYVPDRPALYQQVPQPGGTQYLFTGDPVPFGYEGPRTVFYGAHPVPVRVDMPLLPRAVYCSIRGPHYHDYAAPATPEYRVKDNVVFYVGPLAPEFARARPQMERQVEAEYRPYVALRPQVTVAPPPEWHGEVWVAAPAPPGVSVVAPAPPSVSIVAPAPPGVMIVAPVPGVRVEGPRWEFEHGRGHERGWERERGEDHDRGRHRGWFKEHHR